MPSENLTVKNKLQRAEKYNPEWIIQNASGGANAIWLTDWLSSSLDLQQGMKVLDLGCGRAASSLFLAREFGVTVWATDLWFSTSENKQRIDDCELSDLVFPIHSDARSLPFATEFFDAIVSIDAIPYFGTDDHYLSYLARFVKPGGIIAIALAGFIEELNGEPPEHLKDWFTAEPALWSMHSAPWWKRHWERTGIVDVEIAESMPEGWRLWVEWLRTIAPDNRLELAALETDAGRNLGYNRVIARRRGNANLEEPILSIPANYVSKPLLRSDA